MNSSAESAKFHKSLVCRICATRSSDPLISIYCGGSNNFSLKIMFYLPIKVAPNDGLPLNICTSCLDAILKWDDFYQNCIDADKHLKNVSFQNTPLNTNSVNINSEKTVVKSPDSGMLGFGEEEILIGEEVIFDEDDKMIPSSSLNLMIKKDTGNSCSSFLCPDCGLAFLLKEEFAIHSLEVHHKHQALQSFLRQQLNTVDEMHIIKGAKIGANSYHCKHCGRIFGSPSKLKVHVRIHTGLKPFKCLLCEKRFRQTCHTVTHMKLTHFNIRRYHCKICQKHFKVRSKYKIHMHTHRREDSFNIYFNNLY